MMLKQYRKKKKTIAVQVKKIKRILQQILT